MQPRASIIPHSVYTSRNLSPLGKIVYGWLYAEPDTQLSSLDLNAMAKVIGSPEPRALRKCLRSLVIANLITQSKEKNNSKAVIYRINKEYFNG